MPHIPQPQSQITVTSIHVTNIKIKKKKEKKKSHNYSNLNGPLYICFELKPKFFVLGKEIYMVTNCSYFKKSPLSDINLEVN